MCTEKKVKKAVLYPFSGKFMEFLLLETLQSEYTISAFVSLPGAGLENRDLGCADNRGNIGITSTTNLDAALACSDCLILLDNFDAIVVGVDIASSIWKAYALNKEVICTFTILPDMLHEIQNAFRSANIKFRYCVHEQEITREYKDFINQPRGINILHSIDAPVIFVGGILDNLNNFEVMLATVNQFQEMGKKVSSIGSKKWCEIFGVHSLPSFMTTLEYGNEDKVFLFNKYVKWIETTEQPDIIVVELPGAIMPYSKFFPNGFGINTFLISQSLQPDYFIFCTLLSSVYPQSLGLISKTCEQKYGYPINCIHVSNGYVDSMTSNQNREISILYIPVEVIWQHLKSYREQLSIPAYNFLDMVRFREVCLSIKKSLDKNREMLSML